MPIFKEVDTDKLKEYALLDGTEIGDYLISLLQVAEFDEPHGMNIEFKQALREEMANWLDRFENETTIESHSIPQPNKIYKELIWNDEQ